MSILNDIRYWELQGRLALMHPALSSIPITRKIYASTDVSDCVLGRISDSTMRNRGSKLRADLDLFIGGGLITVSLTPHKAGAALMGLLHPESDGIWDIRSRDPNPGLRVLGGFAERDIFIALTWETRKQLGAKDSPEWRTAIQNCKTNWRNLFPTFDPLTGDDLDDYISKDTIRIGDI
jgi:hypothetical protein